MADRINFTKASLAHLQDTFEVRRMVYDAKLPGLAAELRSADSLVLYLYKRIDGRPTKVRLGAFQR